MTTTNFLQKARRALVLMRKASVDAFLLTTFIVILLVFTGIFLTYPWLIILIYALAYLVAVLLRLRKTTHDTTVAYDQKQSFEIGQMLYVGMAEPLQQQMIEDNH